jgi:hypothetical protein
MSRSTPSRPPRGTGPGGKITRDDIERKLASLQGDVKSGVDAAAPIAFGALAVAGVVIVLGAFLLGRRKGKNRTAVLEIRRI